MEDPNKKGQSVLEDGPWISAETSRELPATLVRSRSNTTKTERPWTSVGKRESSRRRFGGLSKQGTKPASSRYDAGLSCWISHHLKHWADGGETNLSNLFLLCNRHHRCVHERGYGMESLPNGKLQFCRPDGRAIPPVPLPHPLGDDPVANVQSENEKNGLQID